MSSISECFVQIPKRPQEDCSICLGKLNKRIVAHTGCNGAKHPAHWECVEAWLKEHLSCPSCNVKIETREIKDLHQLSNSRHPKLYRVSLKKVPAAKEDLDVPLFFRLNSLKMGLVSTICTFSRYLDQREANSLGMVSTGCLIATGITLSSATLLLALTSSASSPQRARRTPVTIASALPLNLVATAVFIQIANFYTRVDSKN